MLIPVLIQPIAGLIAHITTPITNIPPNGYIIIFSTSTPRILADIKWPSSWTIIRKLIIIKMEKDAVIIASKAKIYTKGFISIYLYIVFIIQILPIFWKYHI